MSDRSATSGRAFTGGPLSPTPRRWSEVPPTGDGHQTTGSSGTSPGGSPFGVRTQAVINDVERMLSRLSEAAEAVDQLTAESTDDRSRDSFHTAQTEQEEGEETTNQHGHQLAPPLRPFLSTRRSAEALRPRSEGVSRLDPARMSLFSPPQPSRLRKAESNNSLFQLFGERMGRGESAFGVMERMDSPVSTPTRSRLMGSRDSPLRRSFRPEEDNEKTPTSEKIVRPRSTPPREQTVEKDELRTASPSKDMFGPRLRPKLPPRRPTTEDPVTPTGSSNKPVIRPLNTPRMPPPLPPRTPSFDRSIRDPDAESISGTSIDCTSSEAGRELDKALESIGSGHSRASTSLGSLLSTESGYTSNGIAPRNVPLPASPASSRLAQSEVREVENDSPRTPRAVPAPLSVPHTPISNPYPAPARSWIRDPYVARTLDNMGIEGPRRELLTPVEERTERTRSWSSGITPEPSGKPLPLVPPIEGLPRSLFSTPSSANMPGTPTAARASNLIKFFESAANTGLPQSVPMERSGLSPGHWRGLSEPAPVVLPAAPAAAPAVEDRLQPEMGHSTWPAVEPVVPPQTQVSSGAAEGVLAHLRRGRASPMRSVRNVVAAWRGRVMPLSRSGSVNSFASNRMEPEDEYGLVVDQRETKDNDDHALVDDAFVTIRRKSTKKRPASAQMTPVLPRYDSADATVGSPEVKKEKPLPVIQELRNARVEDKAGRSRGQIVSTYTTMTSEPVRIGELWYLNVHGGETFTWIHCDAELYGDRLVLSWMPEGSRGSRGVVTLDLAHCQEVRSVPSPNHPSARDDIGSVAARQHSTDLASSLYPFQLVYEDGIERLGCGSARDRVRWVSAIWDVLENGPHRSDGSSDGIRAPSSENGSGTTRLQSPQMIDRQSSLHRNSRAMDDGLIRDSQGSMFPVIRNLSKRVNAGPMLRRIASEADLSLGENVMHEGSIAYGAPEAFTGTNVLGSADIADRPVSPSTTLLTETDIGPSASLAIPTSTRLEASSSTSDVFGTAFSLPTLERRSAQRAPRSQVTSYRTPLSTITTASQATVRPRARRGASEQFDGISVTSYDPNVLDILDEESIINGEIAEKKLSPGSGHRGPRPPSYSRQDTRGTNYFTASQGTLGSYVSARDVDEDSMISSDWHGASAIDRATTVSTTTLRTKSKDNGTRSTGSSRTGQITTVASSVVSRVSETIPSTAGSTFRRSSARSTSIVSSTPTREPDHHMSEEQKIADGRGIRSLRSQLNRIEEQVAGIGSFLAVDKVSEEQQKSQQMPKNSTVPSSSSSDTSSSSSDASSSPPSTPSSGESFMKREVVILKDYMEDMLDRSDDLINGQEKLRQLMEDKLVSPPDHMVGRAPTLRRIEDLLLRLLVRSGDSEILDEYGGAKEHANLFVTRSPTLDQSASGHSRFSDPETELSTETDVSSIRAPAPPGSLASTYRRTKLRDGTSDISSSLLVTTPRIDGELDEDWELQNLPRGTPPLRGPRQRAAPPDLSHLRGIAVQDIDERYLGDMPDAQSADSQSETPIAPQRAAPVAPISLPMEHDLPRTPESRTPTPPRPRTHRPGPLPRPLDVPSPVMPGRPSTFVPSSLRPGTIPPIMPRPSRLAGAREPMTTTYFRRGFPPPMLPPPMVGPHMGPYASGMLQPGLPGFGGPFGPNVFPRPGYPPPGAMGPDGYGLPRRPFFPPRPPRGDLTPQSRGSRTLSYTSYSDASSSSDGTLEEIKDAVEHLDEVQHQAIDAGQALAEAQVTQQNEISRYLHEMGDALQEDRKDHYNELLTLHEDIGRIRDQLANPQTQVKVIAPNEAPAPPPKAMPAPAPSAIPIVTTTTSTLAPPELEPPVVHPPTQTSVSVNVPPQAMPAAVMTVSEHSGHASPIAQTPLPLVPEKDLEQDIMLRDLQRKVADLMSMMARERRGKTTEVEVSHGQPGDVETIKITEVEKGPGPLPPKTSEPQEIIRITESQSGPIEVASGPTSSANPPPTVMIDHQPTIIPSEPLKVSSSGPSVHFAPEHVKETVTEQVIKGPGNVPVVEKETVREYDRTSSDVAAGRAPRHETIIERETVSGPAGQPGTLEKITEVIHDPQPPPSMVPPSTAGSDHIVVHTHPDGLDSSHTDVVEVVRNPSKRSKGSRAGTHVPKTTVVVEGDAGHPMVTTTIEEHDTGGRYPSSATNAPTVLVHDSASQAPPRTTRVPTVVDVSDNVPSRAPTTIVVDHPTPLPPVASAPPPMNSVPLAVARPTTQAPTIPPTTASAPVVIDVPASGPPPTTSTSNIPPGLAVRPVPVVADPITTTANVKPASSGIVRDRPVAVPNPVQLSDPPAVLDPVTLGDARTKPVTPNTALGDRPTSAANVSAAQPAQTPRPPSVVKQKPPPPRPVFDENDFAPPVESTAGLATRPSAPTVPASTAPVSHTVANVPAETDAPKPVGLLRKQPPSVKQAPPIVSDANVPTGAANPNESRVRFETPVDNTRPVSQVGNVPAARPTQATTAPVATVPPSAAPVVVQAPAAVQPAPPAVQPVVQPTPAQPQPVSIQAPAPVVAPSAPTVQQPPPTIAPKPLQPSGLANVPPGDSTKATAPAKPIREQPAVQPTPVVPSPIPVVTSDVPQTGAHNVVPQGADLRDGSSLAADPSGGAQAGRKPNVLKKAPPTQVHEGGLPSNTGAATTGGHVTPGQPLRAQEPLTSLGNVPGQSDPVSIRKGHPTVDDGSQIQDPLKRPAAPVTTKTPVVQPAPGSVNNLPAQSANPEAALAERDRIAAQSKANAERAEQERLEKERAQKEREAADKLASDRHREHQDALSDIKKTLQDHGATDTRWKQTYADDAKAKEKRRMDRTEREKKWQDALDKLIIERDNDKKWREGEAKKPGSQAVMDALKKHNDDLTAFLRSLAADIVAQNTNQHQQTQQAAKAWAREQVAFNLGGYLDDFSKALSSEVRALLKEVGDLRETRRALYYELAELLLMKGRQSHGDLMAVLPFPTGGGVGPGPGIGLPKAAPPKPNPPAAKPEPPKATAPPAWQTYSMPPNMTIGNPGGAPPSTAKNGKPPSGARPLPVPGDVVITTTTTHPA